MPPWIFLTTLLSAVSERPMNLERGRIKWRIESRDTVKTKSCNHHGAKCHQQCQRLTVIPKIVKVYKFQLGLEQQEKVQLKPYRLKSLRLWHDQGIPFPWCEINRGNWLVAQGISQTKKDPLVSDSVEIPVPNANLRRLLWTFSGRRFIRWSSNRPVAYSQS